MRVRKRFAATTLALALSCAGASLAAPVPELSLEQVRVLTIARDEGAKACALGECFSLTTQLVAMQETHAGAYGANASGWIVADRHLPYGQRSYGICGIRVETARDVLLKHPELGTFATDEELMVALITNTRFNLRIAAHHLALLYKATGGNWRRTLLAYNRGLRGSADGRDPNNYVAKALAWRQTVITPFNRGEFALVKE